MCFSHCRISGASLACSAVAFLQASQLIPAHNHIGSPEEVRETILSAAGKRRQSISKLEKFFSSNRAEKTLKSSGIDSVQVKNTMPTLSSHEPARLASRAGKAQKDFAAGSLTHGQATLITLAAATVANTAVI